MHLQTHAADDDKPKILDFMDGHPGMKQLKHTKSVKEYSHKFNRDKLDGGDQLREPQEEDTLSIRGNQVNRGKSLTVLKPSHNTIADLK